MAPMVPSLVLVLVAAEEQEAARSDTNRVPARIKEEEEA
jgi:hypothetical protein